MLPVWLLLIAFAFITSYQLACIVRSTQVTAAMMKRLLAQHGIDWEAAAEPSAKVRELASLPAMRVEAIKAYREQTGLDLKAAKAVVDRLRAQQIVERQ